MDGIENVLMPEEILAKWIKISKFISYRYMMIAGLAYLIFYVILKNKVINRKIQEQFPSWKDKVREMLFSFQTIIIFGGVAALIYGPFFEYTNIYREVDKFGWAYLIFTIPVMFIIHDTYFYWMHRAIHHPKLFKSVHLIHHKSTNPSPWASYAFHPIESVLEAAILPIIAFTIPVHISAFLFFFLMQFVYNVYGHLGFELYPKNFSKSFVGKWVNTSVAHNMHHKFFKGNYGLYFLFWDRTMGTLNPKYDEFYDKTTNK
jgi:Delta7-sterol 5-desaturase